MALITCQECEKEVSDKAATCPNCGAPINDKTTEIEMTNKSLKFYILISFFGVFFVAPFFWFIIKDFAIASAIGIFSLAVFVCSKVASWWRHG